MGDIQDVMSKQSFQLKQLRTIVFGAVGVIVFITAAVAGSSWHDANTRVQVDRTMVEHELASKDHALAEAALAREQAAKAMWEKTPMPLPSVGK